MAYLNNVNLIGNLGKDAVIRVTPSGRKCAQLTLATSRRYRDNNGEQKEDTQWHNVVVWGKLADVIETMRLAKGTSLYVGGMITYRKWEKDGKTSYTTEIVADNIQVLTPRGNMQQNGYSQGGSNPYHTEQKAGTNDTQDMSYDPGEEDLPF